MNRLLLIFFTIILLNFKTNNCKKAFITGITGQDGSYLAEFLLKKDYEVHGLIRRTSINKFKRLKSINKNKNYKNKIFYHYGDVTDFACIAEIIKKIEPDEIYNLAAQSDVKISFENAYYTSNTNALGSLTVLEAIRILDLKDKIKFYQASSSEMFGKVVEVPQTARTPFYPRSPYSVAKLYAHWITINYRESYGIFACSGILFNHESPRRGSNFVTRKITKAISKIVNGLQDVLKLGNLNAKRDWGYSKDYVKAMWLMLQQKEPKDFVIATGETHSVREFLELAFKEVGTDIRWEGSGLNEIGINRETGKVLVQVDPYFFRPAEVDLLIGDSTESREILNWKPKTSFEDLIKIMVHNDLKVVKKRLLKKRLVV